MTQFSRRITLGMLTLVGAFAGTVPALSQQVTLTSSDGSINLTGDLREVRDNAYLISTVMGDMRVSSEGVTCTGQACPKTTTSEAALLVGGSDTVGLGLMPLILEGYGSSLDAKVNIDPTGTVDEVVASIVHDQGYGDEMGSILVNSTTSSDGFRKLLANEIEIGMASRRIRPAEARALRDDGAGNMINPAQEHIIAIDSLVLVTNPENDIDTLTADQVRRIYAGLIANWAEVGGADLPITVVTRPDGSGTRSVFESRIFGDSGLAPSRNAIIAQSNQDASRTVIENLGAIAYVGYAFQRDARPVTLINDCGIATEPTAFSARTEEYALQRRLYVYSREDTLSEEGNAFLDYATSEAADTVIGKAGFIGFAVDRREQSLEGRRARALLDPNADAYEARFMRSMLSQMADYDRLSTTFRFRTGSSQLDERGRIDQDRLINYLAQQPANTEVVMVGFTDGVGQFDSNLNLSAQRAAQVAAEIRETAGDKLPHVTIQSVGYGEIAPSGCNNTEEGRRINRRVEVWIKS
ncbi:phosphate ABC transporter substrate-binding/OmpA family protein [Cognatiyoonia sp. IB215182]|uniref:phosphate ABC transporter substrate-binding/OmpA family protein n=1 Tax=Cognatiyoonia sp. IB215182 TaxID=3097353 RepID=UPI002A144031|nr:phosphate ABC transporter substrate-binding/OmpA family protein [Cognatiyoonia sp. IB215182]MDX8351225.1 phosphate ABC transporter substrate-binding/OmpA family protein [Cognatiyoonia sp. IB215182]